MCTRPRVKLDGTSFEIDAKVKEIVGKVLSVYEVLNDTLKEASPDVIVTQNLCEVCAVALPDVEAAVCDWVGTDIDIVSLNAESISAVYDDIRRVAVSLNAVNTGAEVVERMQSRFTEVAERAADLDQRPRVACIEWADPLMAAGNWIPEFVEAAGAENLFGSAASIRTGWIGKRYWMLIPTSSSLCPAAMAWDALERKRICFLVTLGGGIFGRLAKVGVTSPTVTLFSTGPVPGSKNRWR